MVGSVIEPESGAIFAKHILVGDGSVLRDSYITIDQGIVTKISRHKPDGEVLRIDGALLPGLVNAHTHLEFSDLKEPLGQPNIPFTEWVGLVVAHRNRRDEASSNLAIESGIEESKRAGTVAIGEISTFDYSIASNESTTEHSFPLVNFRELIGFQDAQVQGQIDGANDFLLQKSAGQQPGLSPHAPYSVNHQTIDFAISQSADSKVRLAMHLAETEPELELLANHSGPFRDLLERLGVWQASNFRVGTRPLDFLRRLSKADHALVIHGNYLKRDELEFLSENRNRLSLVYCPRTHHFFGHESYPIKDIQELQIPLAIGTDSRASNPDLSIWKEMEFLLEQNQFPPQMILQMATLHGAMALGLGKELGSIEIGKQARFFVCSDLQNPMVASLIE